MIKSSASQSVNQSVGQSIRLPLIHSFLFLFLFFSFYHSLLRTTLHFFHHHHHTPNQIQNQKRKSSIQNLQSLVQANKILSRRDSSSAFSSSSLLYLFFLVIAIFTIQDISALPSKNLPSLSKLNSHYSYDLITNAYEKSVGEISLHRGTALLCSKGIGTFFFLFFPRGIKATEIEGTCTYKTQRSLEEELVRGGGGGGGGGGIFAQLLPFVGFLVSILGEPGFHIFFFYLLFRPCVLCGGEFHNRALVFFLERL